MEAFKMDRFWVAMGAYLVLAILAWMHLTAQIPGSGGYQVRHVVVVILTALAVSTWIHRRDRREVDPDSSRKSVEGGGTQ